MNPHRELQRDCLVDMLFAAMAQIRKTDMTNQEDGGPVLQGVCDLLAAMPNAMHRADWLNIMADCINLRHPSIHRNYVYAAIAGQVQEIRKAKGLPV